MRSRIVTLVGVLTIIAVVAIPIRMAGQEQEKKHDRYKVIDLGTFGGPNSQVNGNSRDVNPEGTVAGAADTAVPDPYAPNCFVPECVVMHAFRWRNGVLADLGALQGGGSSYANAINSRGTVVGQSENGIVDPQTGVPNIDAAIWKHGQIIDLGTFGGPNSLATAINNWDEAVGAALNTIPDSFNLDSLYGINGITLQSRAFRWRGGGIEDLGTLGGPDAIAIRINDWGQITGASFTSSTPNPDTGAPTVDPFLWESGKMKDLGGLGGTIAYAVDINNVGEVAGVSDLQGDTTFHPFLWDGHAMKDLGTLGGTYGAANLMNDAGDVVGYAAIPGDQAFHAFLWRRGVLTDLGTLEDSPFSLALGINLRGQIVGCSGFCSHAFLWEHGEIIDLNKFVPTSSGLTLTEADFINDQGEIAATGTLPNGDFHALVLIPCDQDTEDCMGDNGGARSASQFNAAPLNHDASASSQKGLKPNDVMAAMRARMARRYLGFGTTQLPPK